MEYNNTLSQPENQPIVTLMIPIISGVIVIVGAIIFFAGRFLMAKYSIWDLVTVLVLLLMWLGIGGGAWWLNASVLQGSTGSLFWWLTIMFEIVLGLFFSLFIFARLFNATVVQILGVAILLLTVAIFIFTFMANLSLDACVIMEEEVVGVVDPGWLRALVYGWYAVSGILLYGGYFLMKNSDITKDMSKYGKHYGKILFGLGLLSMGGLMIGYASQYRCSVPEDQQPTWIPTLIWMTWGIALLLLLTQQIFQSFLFTVAGFLLMDGCRGQDPTYSSMYSILFVIQGLVAVIGKIFGKRT